MTGVSLFQTLCDEVITDLRNYAVELENEINFPESAHLAVNISDSDQASASASWNATDGCYQITLDRALCVWAFDVAVNSSIHIDSDFNSNVSHRLNLSDYSRKWSIDEINRKSRLAEQRLPPHQNGVCHYLFGTVCLVIFCHELAHIFSGHVDYLKSRRKSDCVLIDELNIARQSEKATGLPLRFLEFEADYTGARWLVELAGGKRFCPRLWRGYTVQQNLVMGLWAFVLFTISLTEAVSHSGYKSGQYPEPMLRFTTAVSAMNGIWNKQVPDAEFQEEIFLPVADLLQAFESLYPAIDHARDFADANWANAMKYKAAKLATDHKQMTLKLDPYRLNFI